MNHRNFERILRLWVTTSTSVSGTVPNNLNPLFSRLREHGRRWRVSVMGKISFSTGKGRSPRRSKCKGTVELEPKGPDELASRDVPAFPREERHHRAPWGTRHRRLGAAVQWRGFIISLPGGLDGSDEPTGPPELKGVCFYTLFWTRSEISRDYPLNLSISLSGGKETNQDSPSNGE